MVPYLFIFYSFKLWLVFAIAAARAHCTGSIMFHDNFDL